MSSIPVIVYSQDSLVPSDSLWEPTATLSEGDSLTSKAVNRVKESLSSEDLGNAIHDISASLQEAVQDIPEQGGFALTEFKVTLEVNGKGKLGVVGSIEAGGKGGIALTFKRKE